MNVVDLPLPGLKLIEPKVFGDARGQFLETWNAERYAAAGIPGPFIQDNLSRSRRNTMRGLHWQNPNAQGKLVSVVAGTVWDAVVDIRRASPTFGKWYGVELTAENRRQLWVPAGFAHGFAVLSDFADFAYKVTGPYSPKDEHVLRWDDPAIGIDWKIDRADAILSPRDASAPGFSEIAAV
ncbi:MAG: dTDP-4-dehydrorhamnose 3,5-epimerase [Alphaproteobacteria bacterium]|nr:dTDP-4-dehydrorhamnose 3,5-epimerase [Alphaproteobacteria bacterium]